MELMQLEMFVAVVEECSVRRAAERVYRTQPAVSIALGKLQQEIGTLLLEDTRRTNRQLTKAGEILYQYASRMINMRNEALQLLRGEVQRYSGSLFIGVGNEESHRLISQLISAFGNRHPGVRIMIRRRQKEKLLTELHEGKIDFALLPTQQETHGAGADLVVNSTTVFGQERSLWVVRRRAHQSQTMKVFAELLNLDPEIFANPGESCQNKKGRSRFRPLGPATRRLGSERQSAR